MFRHFLIIEETHGMDLVFLACMQYGMFDPGNNFVWE